MKKLYVSNKDESVRMFKSDFLEMFTKVHWSVPLIIYIPVIAYFIYQSVLFPEVTLANGIGLFFVGLFTWTVTEYFMHRYVFHFTPHGKFMEWVHFTFHGVHHDYPNDSNRLVMPPAMSVPLAFGFYFLFKTFLGVQLVAPFFVGLVFGYVCYDMMHYALHHANFSGKYWNELKAHHLKHHFKDPESGFGVSSKLWDIALRSDFKHNKKSTSKVSKAIEREQVQA